MTNNDQTQPNIIMIMTDQQRFDTISELGFEQMHTPNMDQLVKNGTTFEQSFCPGATCVPSRAAIFTGMYPHNTGVYNLFNSWGHQRSWVHDLAENGYHCVNIGKMHVAPTYDSMGFHERFVVENPQNELAKADGREDEWGRYLSFYDTERPLNQQLTDPDWMSKYQGVPWELAEHLHSDVFIGNSALAWINRHKQTQPVFLQIGFTGPHEVYDPLPRQLDHYADKKMPDAVWKEDELSEKPPQHYAHQEYFRRADGDAQVDMANASEKDIQHLRRHYFAKISTIDEKIGEIMKDLEAKGYLDNAIVVFTSDHGDMLGDHKLPYKWLMYDAAVKVPLIVWDTRKEQLSKNDDLISLIDIGPTILESVGIKVPEYLDGHSFLNKLYDANGEPHRKHVICEDNYLTMIRNKSYKLVNYTFQEDDGELYDLTNDPNELNNLFNDDNYKQIKQELKMDLLQDILRSTYSNATYKNRNTMDDMLYPKDNHYLHPITKKNPTGWYNR